MTLLKRLFWALSLMFFLAGCSGYKTACTSHDGPGFPNNCGLEQGDKVRVLLVGGERVTGEVISASDLVIILAGDPEAGNTRSVFAADILSVEKETSYTKQKTVGLVLVLGAIMVTGSIIANNTKSTEPIPIDWSILF